MSQVVLNPAVAGDDGYINRADSGYFYNTGVIQFGVNTYERMAFIRFPSVAINQGQQIDTAVLKLQSNGIYATTCVVRIYCNKVGDATAPSSYSDANGKAKTTAYKEWTVPNFALDTDYEVDITDPVQEILDQAEWASGNAIMILIDTEETGIHYRVFKDVSTVPATLTINYTVESETIEVPSADLMLYAPSGIQILPIFTPVAALTLTPYSPTAGLLSQIANAPELSLSSVVPSYLVHLTKHPDVAELTLAAQLPSYVWSIPANLRPAAQVIYTCTLTGDGESPALSDLTLPMSSFQGRMRDGDPSYISAVIPNCMVYADDILARQNGDIVIKKGYRFQDGTTQLEEIARVDFESVRIDQGSKSASATISGHKTISSTSVKTVTVEGVSYYCLQADGKRRVRALLDLFLRIGDTCVYGTGTSDYLTVGYITYTVSVNQTIMEVTEA